MPVVPSCLLEPAWVEFCALTGGEPPEFHPGHPLGCHRRRVPGRVVFEHVVAALVHGSGYERIATPGCSDRTIRRRLDEWADMGAAEALHAAALRAYDQIIGLELGDVAVDGCLTKAPCGGDRAAGRMPYQFCMPGRAWSGTWATKMVCLAPDRAASSPRPWMPPLANPLASWIARADQASVCAGQMGGQGQGRTADLPLFRIKDHSTGPAREVSRPAQRPAVHADGRRCT